jgi:DNA invertase Pin-like site-specific DNA recombinase
MLAEWGWRPDMIEVVEGDLGVTGTLPGIRDGFAGIIAQMRAGAVGIVAVTDTSRLSRNSLDSALFEVAARHNDVLLAQSGQVTDFSDPNSAFVQAVLGANAARENRARADYSMRARRKKAKKGIAITSPPAGYLSARGGTWVKDPDVKIRDIIQLVFTMFPELGSTGALVRAFRKQGLYLPLASAGWRTAMETCDEGQVVSHSAKPGIHGSLYIWQNFAQGVYGHDRRNQEPPDRPPGGRVALH